MGVPGLWEILRGTEESKSLTSLAWSHYFTAKDFKKTMKVGIDVSIWLFQATSVAQHDVQNHALLILFFKLCHLVGLPVQLLFVFDGPGRPAFKRGKTINTSSKLGKGLEKSFKTMIHLFGFEIWEAPGEAEAELGYLNDIGALDAIITEDVDALLFKAKTVLVKPEKSSKSDNRRYNVFRSKEIARKHRNVDADGLILVALLSGGDYDQEGLSGCGPKISFQLACENYGSALVDAYRSMSTETFLSTFLPAFRMDLSDYLRRDPQGLLGRKMTKLAQEIENTPQFPDLRILESYVNPLTSASDSVQVKWKSFGKATGLKLGELGAFAGKAFGWGKEDVIKRLGSVLADKWMAEVLLMELRRPGTWVRRWIEVEAELNETEGNAIFASVSPTTELYGPRSSCQRGLEAALDYPTIIKITTYRKHGSTDELLEYRCLMEPARFSYELTIGIRGLPEPPPRSPKKKTTFANSSDENDEDNVPSSQAASSSKDHNAPFLVWLPYKLIRHTHPSLVQSFNEREEQKVMEKHEKEKRAAGRKAGMILPTTDLIGSCPVSQNISTNNGHQNEEPSSPIRSSAITNSKFNNKLPEPTKTKASSLSISRLDGHSHNLSFPSRPSPSLPHFSSSSSTSHMLPRRTQHLPSYIPLPIALSPSKTVNVSRDEPSQYTPRANSKVRKPLSSIYIPIESPPSSLPKTNSKTVSNATPVPKLPSGPLAFPMKLSRPKSTTTSFDTLASDLLSSLPSTTLSPSQASPSVSSSSSSVLLEPLNTESFAGDKPLLCSSTMSTPEVIEISDSDESDGESGLSYRTKIRKNAVKNHYGAGFQSARSSRSPDRRVELTNQTELSKWGESEVGLSNCVTASCLPNQDRV
ncbi:5'-3' exonuclease [Phaffia rhodozyma]|uniref:5'-3' exonuclease n=1 Tax=Phaffia rhodozyma TaxID=264483 RepID=A0A0F7ST37_PHARH|nr:5'-3' exonuclease [Phaffia rhodozyma]